MRHNTFKEAGVVVWNAMNRSDFRPLMSQGLAKVDKEVEAWKREKKVKDVSRNRQTRLTAII